MHSFAQTNGQCQQIGCLQQASQAAPHPPHDATSALSANYSHQHMTVNSSVQQPQNYALQNGSYVDGQLAAKYSHGPQTPIQQMSYQYSTNQDLSNATSPNTTYPRQDMTVPWAQSVAVNKGQITKALNVSHLQQYASSQSLYQTANVMTRQPSSFTAATPSPQQIVNPNTLMSAGSQNVQISQVAPKQFEQNGTEGRFVSAYQSSWGVVASQPFGRGSVSMQTFSNRPVSYTVNTSQTPQQPTTHPCSSYNNWGKPDNSRSSNMMNQSNSNFSLMKTNEVPLNPAGGSQQMLWHYVNADSLSNFSVVGSNLDPPPYSGQHFASIPKMSKQNIQPVTSANSESYNFNATQPVSRRTGQPLPQSAMSRGWLPQKRSPKDSRINSKRDKEKKATNPLPNNSMISKECPVVLPSLCSPVKQNDNSSHSVLGHTSTKAVAVVPPLSQERENTFSNATTCESVDTGGKTCVTPELSKGAEAAFLREESNLNQNISNLIETSKTANHGAFLTASDSESLAHKPSEAPASETCSKEQNETTTPVLELSSLPTNAWTAEALNKFILEMEQAQPNPEEYSYQSIAIKLLITVWNKNVKAMLKYFKARQLGCQLYFENLNMDISDKSVILTDVKPDFKDHLKHYHVLVDGEVYSEQPYKSLWLNVNRQLDDIDKEFGFPWSLKQHLYVHETDVQMDSLETESSILEPIVNEVHSKVLSQTESVAVDRVEEKVSTVECSPPPPAPQSESENSSSDSDHTFKIEVLPPEAAKSIFEQVQTQTPQSTDCENATVSTDSLQTGITKDANSTSKTDSMENKSNDKIKEICCLAKFMEMYSISDVPFYKCMCNFEQSCNGQTVKTPTPDPDSSGKSIEVTKCQTITLSASELCSKLEQIIDLTDEDDPSSQESEVDQEMEIISQISTGRQLNIVTKSENEDNDVSSTDFLITSSPFTLEISETESEDNSSPEELKSTESIPSNTSLSSTKQTESDQVGTTEAENVLELSDRRGNCEQADLKSIEEAESPLEPQQQTQTTFVSHNVKEKPTEKKRRQSSLDNFFPGRKPSKCKRHKGLDSLDVPEAQPKASKIKTVELVLFGSGQKRRGLVPENEKNTPPEVLSVNLDSARSKSLETNCPKKYSAKQLIYERWRSSFPSTLSGSILKGFRNKLKRQKRLSASLPSTTLTNQQSVSSEVQVPDGLTKNRLSLKRRRSFSLIRRHEKVKRRRYSVTVEQPANRQENEKRNGNLNAMPNRENIVLKFSVLPNTFHFKDGSGRMESSDSVSDTPDPEDKNQNLKKTDGQSKGAWCPATEEQPLRAPQAVGLFYEYQKKYKEKTQISDELSNN